MTKKIETLVSDIYDVLKNGVDEVPEELVVKYSEQFGQILRTRLTKDSRNRGSYLRMSNAGKPCVRETYYDVNNYPREELSPQTYNKFIFGDLIETWMLFLTELSGHKVEGTQDVQEIEGIKGHRDGVIDGVIADVKSASPFSFKKFQNGLTSEVDSFGYIDQGGAYLHAGQTDDKVQDKNRFFFFVMDKVSGEITTDIHTKSEKDYPTFFKTRKSQMQSDTPPDRGFEPVPDGASGNEILGVNCSYCAFKHSCHENLRTFMSYKGPKFFTKVLREPRMQEVW